jgi:hypothetical protein
LQNDAAFLTINAAYIKEMLRMGFFAADNGEHQYM